jgi:hypothetical protein
LRNRIGGDEDYGLELTMNHQTVNHRFWAITNVRVVSTVDLRWAEFSIVRSSEHGQNVVWRWLTVDDATRVNPVVLLHVGAIQSSVLGIFNFLTLESQIAKLPRLRNNQPESSTCHWENLDWSNEALFMAKL